MILSGWGRYPVIDAQTINLSNINESEIIIPAGNFRSYGDAALSPRILLMKKQNRIIDFDDENGLLTCEAGVLLADIIEVFLPKGWFLSVTPGTKLTTVGGALASDVHGKNHHICGCFSEFVKSFELLMPDGEIKKCSRSKNINWFHATCGGMGLTGIITKVSFYLKPVSSQWIEQTTIKTSNLKETFEAFEEYEKSSYSVAWIDCTAKKQSLGRGLLMLGDFAKDGDLNFKPKTSNLSIPFDFPSNILNNWSVGIFNNIYYSKGKLGQSNQKVNVDKFFYPLDIIHNWNRIYGKNGFIQFQFILPKSLSFFGLHEILNKISQSKIGGFLAVLKLYGAENKNLLSFPMDGYSLSIDFKMQPGLSEFLHKITNNVIEMGGRIYLAKDALMSHKQIEKCYPMVAKFRKFRKDNNLDDHFQSLLSRRLRI